MEESEPPRLTVAIPLHGAERWLEGIVSNVAKAPSWSRVVISDASGLDDAASALEETFEDDRRVVVRRIPEQLDWVAHCNRLLAEAETDFFCWLPQDDVLLSDDYFERLVAAVESGPDVAIAFPRVHGVYGRGWFRRRPEFVFRNAISDDLAPMRLRSFEIDRVLSLSSLGLPWKGVFRRSLAHPMPRVEAGTASDVIWAFSMLLAGDLVEAPEALYLKRSHKGSATALFGPTLPEVLERQFREEVEVRITDSTEQRRILMAEVRRLIDMRQAEIDSRPGLVGKVLRRIRGEPRPYYE